MSNSSPYTTLILIALMVVAFYFLINRPNKKRQQAQQKTMSALTPGTRVLLTSGLFGTIVQIGEKQAQLELSPGVHLTVLKQAIARVVKEGDEDVAWNSAEDDDVDQYEPDDDASSTVFDPTNPNNSGPTHTITEVSHSESASAGQLMGESHSDTPGRPSSSDQDPYSGTNTTPIKD
jgi:preprotein translocase subunit YajC